MKAAIFVFLFFALAMTVMSAPTLKPRAKCTRATAPSGKATGALKQAANDPKMLFYIDAAFNAEKRAWVSNFLSGRAHPGTAQLKGYFSTDKKAIVDAVAANIDKAAIALLNKIREAALTDHKTRDVPNDPYDCELDLAVAEFDERKKPVATKWNAMKADIAK